VVTVTTRVGLLPLIAPTLVLGGAVSDGGGIDEMYVSVEMPGGDTCWDPVARSGDTWSYTMSPYTVGPCTLRVVARDPGGNTTECGPFEMFVPQERVFLPQMMSSPTRRIFLPLFMRNHTVLPSSFTDVRPRGP
jgi:hypothetical protein